MGQTTQFTGSQVATIKRTVASDTNDQEFNLFMEAAKSYGLDPFRKQISAIVFNKDKGDKRRMAIIVGRDGLRSIAQKCGDYRPASGPAEFATDPNLKSPANPQGIVSCGVTLFKRDADGQWWPVYGEAYWDEFAPIKDEWAYDEQSRKRKPTGQKAVDGNWQKMARLMIQKCAEAQALRAGWPDAFGGLYAEEEIDQAREREMQDITPSEQVNNEAMHRREAALGRPGILMIMDQTGVQERIEIGAFADRCLAFIAGNDAERVYTWSIQNREAMKEFWAAKPNDALAVKAAIEKKTDGLAAA